jgi:hypothetical protein
MRKADDAGVPMFEVRTVSSKAIVSYLATALAQGCRLEQCSNSAELSVAWTTSKSLRVDMPPLNELVPFGFRKGN